MLKAMEELDNLNSPPWVEHPVPDLDSLEEREKLIEEPPTSKEVQKQIAFLLTSPQMRTLIIDCGKITLFENIFGQERYANVLQDFAILTFRTMIRVCYERNLASHFGGPIKELHVRWLPDRRLTVSPEDPAPQDRIELAMAKIEVLSLGFETTHDRANYEEGCQKDLGRLVRAAEMLKGLTLWGQSIPVYFEPGNMEGMLEAFITPPVFKIQHWKHLTKFQLVGFRFSSSHLLEFLRVHKCQLQELLIAHCVLVRTWPDFEPWRTLLECFMGFAPIGRKVRTTLHDLRFSGSVAKKRHPIYATTPDMEELLQNQLTIGSVPFFFSEDSNPKNYRRDQYKLDDPWNIYKDSIVRAKLDSDISLKGRLHILSKHAVRIKTQQLIYINRSRFHRFLAGYTLINLCSLPSLPKVVRNVLHASCR